MSRKEKILELLPYSPPFLFVDQLGTVEDHRIVGFYRFRNDEYFYQGHFKDKPVTPGVILTECMAQIGLVALGIYLSGADSGDTGVQVAFTAADVEYLQPVMPGERVKVVAEKLYWRLGKLKVRCEMFNDNDVLVCRGQLSGMMKAVKNV